LMRSRLCGAKPDTAMIKKVLYFGHPAYLSLKNRQLYLRVMPEEGEEIEAFRPVEDIGILLLDHPRITITHQLIRALQANKAVIVSCNEQHLPSAMMLPMEGHTLQSRRYRFQIQASEALRKNLWQQTVSAKIANQLEVLKELGRPVRRLESLLRKVRSGDPENTEGQAAAYYWGQYLEGFVRDRYGDAPNHLLNYGYAVLRAMVARALVSSGLLPALGIHHRNQYNAYCLADDIMEPFRPFVDLLVYGIYRDHVSIKGEEAELELTREVKARLLSLPTLDVIYGKKRSPLMVGLNRTTASLAACYEGKKRKIVYPTFPS